MNRYCYYPLALLSGLEMNYLSGLNLVDGFHQIWEDRAKVNQPVAPNVSNHEAEAESTQIMLAVHVSINGYEDIEDCCFANLFQGQSSLHGPGGRA
jgi:hypothetical protein